MTFVDFTQQQKLNASDAQAGDYFGYSVAIDGDTSVVGAYYDTHSSVTRAGSAYVFVRSGGVWTQQQKLNASDAEAYDYFGYSVAISGDTAIVGAHQEDPSRKTNAGSAYVFTRSGGVWTQQQKLSASDAEAYDYFGVSVAIDGDTVVVGAHGESPSGKSSAGSAYVFTRSGGTWSQQQKLNASDAEASDYFGYSVAISGDTAIVGAHQEDPSSMSNAGSAYVFTRSGGVWSQQQKLNASDAQEGDRFGYSVGIDGDTAIVGAQLEDPSSISDAGSAYVFTRSGGVWTQQQKLNASDAQAGDRFGYSVGIDGDTAIVGAYNEDPSSISDAGSAYVFTTVLPEEPDEEITQDSDVTKKYTGEPYSLLLRDGDIQVDDNGTPKYDYTAESRVYFRLMCRRGQCWYDPDLGSRLYTIKTLKEARQKVPAYVDEALLPLVKDGTIISATVDDYYEEPITGMLKAHLMITVPSDKKVDLGLIPIGRTMFSQERAQTVPTPAPVA